MILKTKNTGGKAMLTLIRPWSNEMPSLFDRYFSNIMNDGDFGQQRMSNVPAVNISENDDAFVLEVAAPGMKRENFSLNVEENRLIIEGRVEEEKETKEKNYNRREFNFSSFQRTFTLPQSVDQEAIKASYNDGILHIELPKKEEAKPKAPKKIDIG